MNKWTGCVWNCSVWSLSADCLSCNLLGKVCVCVCVDVLLIILTGSEWGRQRFLQLQALWFRQNTYPGNEGCDENELQVTVTHTHILTHTHTHSPRHTQAVRPGSDWPTFSAPWLGFVPPLLCLTGHCEWWRTSLACDSASRLLIM